jgi:flavoprotein
MDGCEERNPRSRRIFLRCLVSDDVTQICPNAAFTEGRASTIMVKTPRTVPTGTLMHDTQRPQS